MTDENSFPAEALQNLASREAIASRTISHETAIFDVGKELYAPEDIGLQRNLDNGETASVIGEAGLSDERGNVMEFAIVKASSTTGDRFVLGGLTKDETGKSRLTNGWVALHEGVATGFGRNGGQPEGSQSNILDANTLWPGQSFGLGHSREHLFVILRDGKVEVRDNSLNGSIVREHAPAPHITPADIIQAQTEGIQRGEGIPHIIPVRDAEDIPLSPEAVDEQVEDVADDIADLGVAEGSGVEVDPVEAGDQNPAIEHKQEFPDDSDGEEQSSSEISQDNAEQLAQNQQATEAILSAQLFQDIERTQQRISAMYAVAVPGKSVEAKRQILNMKFEVDDIMYAARQFANGQRDPSGISQLFDRVQNISRNAEEVQEDFRQIGSIWQHDPEIISMMDGTSQSIQEQLPHVRERAEPENEWLATFVRESTRFRDAQRRLSGISQDFDQQTLNKMRVVRTIIDNLSAIGRREAYDQESENRKPFDVIQALHQLDEQLQKLTTDPDTLERASTELFESSRNLLRTVGSRSAGQ